MAAINYRKWLFQYKLLHVIMWGVVCASTFLTYYDKDSPFLPQASNALMVNVVSTIPFYTTAYVLIPRYLYNKRYAKFILLLFLLVLSSGLLMMIAVRSVDHIFIPARPIIPKDSASLRFAINIFTWTAMIAAFGAGGLKIMSDSFKLRKKLFEVEKEKIVTELNFLRSQINPHFLFNILNTIYFQIDKQNTPARHSVERLSEMLRYQLYECTTDRITIEKEIEYIKSYVAVQTLRLEKGCDIQLEIEGDVGGFKIAPLLILPIVENAFKHISHFKKPSENKITILLTRQNGSFIVNAANTYDDTSKVAELMNSGGLGVQNLRRRLELLYPKRHSLEILQQEDIFHTKLKLQYYD
jgi:hypothetical protein